MPEDFFEFRLAHQLLHLSKGNEALAEDILIAVCPRFFCNCILVLVFADRTAFYYLKSAPFLAMIDSGIRGIGYDFICPLGKVLQLA